MACWGNKLTMRFLFETKMPTLERLNLVRADFMNWGICLDGIVGLVAGQIVGGVGWWFVLNV